MLDGSSSVRFGHKCPSVDAILTARSACVRSASRQPESGHRRGPLTIGQWRGCGGKSLLGSAYGIKTFFFRSADWKRLSSGERPTSEVLERCVFKHRSANVYLVADAYRGKELQQAILNFLDAASGARREQITVKDGTQRVTFNGGGGRIWSPTSD